MDYCHCAEPAPENVNGGIVCLNCRWPYDEQLWNRDSRVQQAVQDRRIFTREQQKLVDLIIEQGNCEHEYNEDSTVCTKCGE